MCDSDSEVDELVANLKTILRPSEIHPKMSFNQSDMKTLLEFAVNSALENQARVFEQKLLEMENKFRRTLVSAPEVEVFTDAVITPGVKCDETLDIVKSLPDFEGKIETYVSWRKAAHTAYKIFENYVGSSKHYQALGIIRNKIKGPADMVLSSYDTPLNFKAIINRLDFTYADKRPIYLIEQELSILRQGNLTIIQYYEEIEKKLTLLINKTIMTYDSAIASSLNEKYRADALRVFISGTKKALSDVLFSARPKDLPSALALAQEVESNHERFQFANNFARSIEEKAHRNEHRQQKHLPSENNTSQPGKNPYFKQKTRDYNQNVTQEPPQPMDIDNSSRFRQPTQNGNDTYLSYPNQASKRANSGTARYTGLKQQRVNHISQSNNFENQEEEEYQEEYQDIAKPEVTDVDDEIQLQELNFLDKAPCCRL